MKLSVNMRWNSRFRSVENSEIEMQTSFTMQLRVQMCVSHFALILGGVIRYFLM